MFIRVIKADIKKTQFETQKETVHNKTMMGNKNIHYHKKFKKQLNWFRTKNVQQENITLRIT